MITASLAVALSTLMFAGLARAVMGVRPATRPWRAMVGATLVGILTVLVMMALIVLVSVWDYPAPWQVTP